MSKNPYQKCPCCKILLHISQDTLAPVIATDVLRLEIPPKKDDKKKPQ